ncbi:hypothetical protein TNCV_5104791 [Trichonephila clavipes]|nr:hypothetical protein TNCV_5104791 [Trichonephila clavipes]
MGPRNNFKVAGANVWACLGLQRCRFTPVWREIRSYVAALGSLAWNRHRSVDVDCVVFLTRRKSSVVTDSERTCLVIACTFPAFEGRINQVTV